ncbi:MAG: hypothetical protein Ct9H90mP16_15630 [Candidatus Poseidoniales archaeon]|nr:MAG: hypothetical protein Ct9H90mP16_15630 [Candidatus Poseidoniales archaeon]
MLGKDSMAARIATSGVSSGPGNKVPIGFFSSESKVFKGMWTAPSRSAARIHKFPSRSILPLRIREEEMGKPSLANA